ncbi:probable cytochrome P450 4d14 [Uloborus diversus]|uniref:probable cytochrome P450 4d14 n=1 Tax=Uloborus diversus TaxID=327109 RepID=UPI002409B6DB|nr:probable cytochrome P450 4d14 [Uloborus diversus]
MDKNKLNEFMSEGIRAVILVKGEAANSGKKWFRRRRQVTLAFHLEVLRGYISVFNEQSFLITEKIRSLSHRPWIEIDGLISQCGHETTVNAIKWIIYLLGLHPDIQEKVFEEQNSLFLDDPIRPLIYEDTCKMKYTECVIKEAMRLFPPTPGIGRIARKDIAIGNQIVPKGSYIGFNIYSLHRNPKVFPEPEKFVPERFLPENSSDRHPYAYIPFSAGPRNCVGQKFAMLSMKVQLSHLLRTFKVSSLDHRDQINVMWKMTLENVKPIRIKFTHR